ncbi:hypothetical protein [Flavobacterium ginsenosidimutans]|uniref:hypothetical protein n=1 Tax=Flavobacterium ginsenosidimutans TaxID=687844 RepID=UPI0013A644D2|nr:hypothetical protein [Flavobacterium ginsenosidimutans]KAF2328799.1 hypothetical protein DM444_17175 [Flavobacterium ginsenosidimutans]
MKNLIITIFIFFFGYLNCSACDCDTPKTILEFYSSKYVFKGIIKKKTFSKDSATYTVKFKVLESYKKGKIPKEISFTSNYKKGNARGSSCYSEEYQYQEWLIFAYEREGKLHFSNICSNSQFIGGIGIDAYTQKILDKGNDFKLEDYIYGDSYLERSEFNYTKPVTDLDSIFKTGKIKDYEKTYVVLALYINEKGKLISVFTSVDMNFSEPDFVYDPIFNLLKSFSVKNKRPLNEFEIEAIALYKKVDWEVKRHIETKVPVKYIRYVRAEFDKETKTWKHDI